MPELGADGSSGQNDHLSDRQAAVVQALQRWSAGGRNLTPQEMSELRGKRYKTEKRTKGAPAGNDNASKQMNQNESFDCGATRKKLAEEYGVSPATIQRDEKFADALAALPNEERQKVQKAGEKEGRW